MILRISTLQQWEIRLGFYTIRSSLVAQLGKNLSAMQETPVQFRGWEILWRRNRLPTPVFLGFPCGSAGKESTCNVGDLGSILGWEDLLKKEMATHSSILAWRIPWTVQSMGLQRVRHNWVIFTSLHFYTIICGNEAGFQGQGSLPIFGEPASISSQYLSPHWKYVASYIMLFTSTCAHLHQNLRLFSSLLLQKLTNLKRPLYIKWKENVSY